MLESNLPVSRITEALRFDAARNNLMDILTQVNRRESELTTGEKVNLPSDDPLAASRIMNLRTSLGRAEQYERGMETAKRRLSHMDTALAGLQDIATRAREIQMSQSGSNGTQQTRRNASFEVANLVDEALTLANRKYNNRYIFGGHKSDTAPFKTVGNYVLFQGSVEEWMVPVSSSENLGSSLSAEKAVGARSAEIKGRSELTPALRLENRLSGLNGGRGVRLGELCLSDGSQTVKVDLTGCVDLKDVVDRFNATGLVTASLRGDRLGLQLEAPGKNLTVSEVKGGRTAGDLGLLKSGAGEVLEGEELNAVLRRSTRIEDLRKGAGLDRAGIKVKNGGIEETIGFPGVDTVGDLISKINQSGTYLEAELNEARNGVNVVSLLNGAEFTLEEAGGSSAADLGLTFPTGELSLDRLNNGFGVPCNFGPDFRVALHDGTEFTCNVSSCETVGEVVEVINNAAGEGGKLSAGYGPGESITLVDNTSGDESFSVLPVKGSETARYLGIQGETDQNTIEGKQLNPAGVRVDGLFNSLVALQNALAEDDRDSLTLLGEKLDQAHDLLLDARADVGGRINRLDMAQGRIGDQKLRLEEAISSEKDVDFAEAALAYQQEQVRLQAALQATSMIASNSLLDFLT